MMVECVFIFLFVSTAVPQPRLCSTCSLRSRAKSWSRASLGGHGRQRTRKSRWALDDHGILKETNDTCAPLAHEALRSLQEARITALFHLNMCTRFGSRPPVTTNIFSIAGWLVRVSHRFCRAPVPYRPVSTPNVERATSWRFQ